VLQIVIGISALTGNVAAVGIFYVIYMIFGLVILWPSIAIMIKRIHDRNKTGWLVLLPYVPLVLLLVFDGIAALAGGGTGAIGVLTVIFMIAFGVIGIWFFVEFGCLRGTIGANQYGPDPVR
jgi:uncharacterized membrane protein YhaH (DUF805 family)